jgi:hypothetical protein
MVPGGGFQLIVSFLFAVRVLNFIGGIGKIIID